MQVQGKEKARQMLNEVTNQYLELQKFKKWGKVTYKRKRSKIFEQVDKKKKLFKEAQIKKLMPSKLTSKNLTFQTQWKRGAVIL